jgi:hypothetical protein
LRWFGQVPGINWANLSNIGQTYGAISALLSTLALAGIAISIFYQARDVRSSREQTSRSIHNELLKMEMEDPFYAEVMAIPWGRTVGLDGYDSVRRNNFIHMWVQFWEGQYIFGEMTEGEVLNVVSAELFVSAYGRQYWSSTRDYRLGNNTGRRLRFVKIVDEEYCKIIDSKFPAAATSAGTPGEVAEAEPRLLSRAKPGFLIFLATGGAILTGRLLSRYLIRRTSKNRTLANDT